MRESSTWNPPNKKTQRVHVQSQPLCQSLYLPILWWDCHSHAYATSTIIAANPLCGHPSDWFGPWEYGPHRLENSRHSNPKRDPYRLHTPLCTLILHTRTWHWQWVQIWVSAGFIWSKNWYQHTLFALSAHIGDTYQCYHPHTITSSLSRSVQQPVNLFEWNQSLRILKH